MINTRTSVSFAMILVLSALGASCSSSDNASTEDDEAAPSGDFEIRSSGPNLLLIEGDPEGVRIPISLLRSNGHARDVVLEVRGKTLEDVEFVTSSFSRLTLSPTENESEAVLRLSISDMPIFPQQREFTIIASDGVDRDRLDISVTVQPTSAPDVYLLAGQSNMEGFSGNATRQAFPGGADEQDPRVKQLNVTKNDSFEVFRSPEDYASPGVNVISPDIVMALDPLHVPQDPSNDSGKDLEYIGLGLSFGKRATSETSADVLLVPAAWSGSSFCQNIDGPDAGWLALPSDNPDLSNTLLFERAVLRANLALEKSGGVFRGILWHQGESDANDRCAPFYEDNMKTLVEQFRSRIKPLGNESLRRVETTYPFVLGTMSRGQDERGDLRVYLDSKQAIDDIHRRIDTLVPGAAWSNHDDLVPDNGFSCGNTSCIHFGPEALREMGRRYYEALLRAVAAP